MEANHAIEVLRSLTADDLRQRLADLAAEQKALQTLLRSAAARERSKAKSRRMLPARAEARQ